MAQASTWYRGQVLNQWFRAQSVSIPSDLYLALHTEDPGADGSGAEVSGGDYARVEIPSNTTNWSAPSTGTGVEAITNLLTLTFPTPTADWGTITHWALWTASSGGEVVIFGELPTPRAVLLGDVAPIVPPSQLTLTAA